MCTPFIQITIQPFSGFFASIYGFLKTSEYLLVLAAVIFRSLGGGGGSYGNKYMEFMFNVSPSNASLIVSKPILPRDRPC